MSSNNIQGSGKKKTGANNGMFDPEYADNGALTHVEMDYNLDLIGEVIKGYHVIGSGTAGQVEAHVMIFGFLLLQILILLLR